MKKRNNQRGFALVETLICAVFVCAVFMLLIVNYYPLLGKVERYQNYDETENIYIAYHLISLIKKNTNFFNTTSVNSTNPLKIYSGNQTESDYLCNIFSENSKEQCVEFLKAANINKVYITNYSNESLKNKISELNVSRAFELYVKYMPTYKESAKTKEANYDRVIIEIKLHDDKTNKDISKYANYEVKVGV